MDTYNLIFSGGFKKTQNLFASGEGEDMNKDFKKYVEGSLVDVDRDMVDGITAIREYAFYQYSTLKSIIIPYTTMNIGNYAFSGCSNLERVSIEAGTTNIGVEAFINCTHLTEINIPSSITSVGSSAFSGCSSLTNINL